MQVVALKVSDLTNMAAPYNPRQISKHDLESLRRSMTTFGVVEPIVVNKRTNRVVGGHQRVKAAEAEGIDELPVVHVDLDELAEKQLNLALNRIHGDWDTDALVALLSDMAEEDIAATGFGDDEVASFIAADAKKWRNRDHDNSPALGAEADAHTIAGDVIQMGDHRLVCGDSTDADTYKHIDAGVSLCLTDPPYSVNYAGVRAIRGGSAKTHEAYIETDTNGATVLTFLKHQPAPVVVMTYPVDRHFTNLARAISNAGMKMKRELVWCKQTPTFNPTASYLQKHEPVLILAKDKLPFYGKTCDFENTTVFDIPRQMAHELHPTQRPMSLWSKLLSNHAKVGDAVVDPFMGSGTTLIACEDMGAVCYGIEMSPAYCDVIVKRWQEYTGKKAEGWRGND
ncbi:MAG: hypothetical protein E4H01_04485 [Lysobacterales bacterium]|nr:MAG: hypothetical protein E4H01_04485 [Xanthomonadales bacterium]